jgi:hypothetical protein
VKWFRLYDELVDDPKVQRLPDALFRANTNLWCINSQNGGVLPPIEDIAFKLHMPVAKAAKVVADLRRAGLIDDDGNGNLIPHNWNRRQFKSDNVNERVKRFRGGKKPDPGSGNETFHDTEVKRPQSQKQNQKQSQRSEQHNSENETARASEGKSLISREAHALAEEIGQVAGFSRETCPPGWCGAAMLIQRFINDGCPGEVIRFAVIGVLLRKKNGAPQSFGYFEKAIAQAFADHQRPLQAANPQPIEARNGRPYRSPSWVELATESIQGCRASDEKETRSDIAGGGGPIIELDAISE